MSDLQTVQNELNAATTALDELRAALRGGDAVDLDTFNHTVTETCDAALALPKDEAPQIRQQLEQLLGELNAARAEISAEQERLAAENAAAAEQADDDTSAGA